MKYSGTTTTNMTCDGNEAATLGLNASEWSVTADKGAGSIAPGLNKAGDFRLYWHADGSNTITVSSLTEATINNISMTFNGTSYNNVTVTVNGNPVTADDKGVYTINSTSFVLGNGNTSNTQVRIKEVVIDYTPAGTPSDTRTATTISAGSNQEGIVGTTMSLPAAVVKAGETAIEGAVVTWTSSDVEVAKIDGTTLQLLKAGTATITASFEGDENYKPCQDSFTLTVKEAPVNIANIAAATALENGKEFNFTGEALVVAKPTAKHVYIKDASGVALIYDASGEKTAAAEVGKTIAANWTGKVSIFNKLFELVPDAALVMKDGEAVAVEYPEVAAADITAENVNKVVTLKGITTYTVEGQNIAISVGENNVVGYNQFGLEIAAAEEGKTYKIVGAISRYKENIQFQPISIEEQVFEAVDCTAKVDVNGWKSDIGNVGPYTKDVAQKEQYLTNTTTQGEVLYQTVEGLDNGTYTVELYANASYTAGRDFASTALNGDLGRVIVYAGDVEKTIPVIYQTGVGENNIVTLENVVVSDGTLRMGLRKDIEGSNWHTIQIKALTQTSDKAEANAAAQDEYWKGIAATIIANENYKNVAGVEKAAIVAAETKAAVQAAIPSFYAAKAAYDGLAQAIADAEAANVDVTEAKAILTNAETTAEKATEALHIVKLAVNTSKATEGADMTFVIVNPSFETGNTEGWTYATSNDHGAKENSNGTYSMANCDGNYLFNIWSSGNAISQVIEDLPNGTYKLSAIIATDGGHKVQLNANDKSIQIDAVDKGTGVQGEVEFNVLNHKATIGAEGVDKYWYKVDNFRLTYVKGFDINGLVASYEEALRAAQAIEGKMNKDVKTALDAAIATEVDKTNPDSLSIVTAALTDATAAAKASVAAFANATNVLPKMKELTESTNVYTAEALAEYYTQWLEKYEAETLTTDEGNALQDPSIVTGWHASITVDNFLLSAWDTNPDFVDAPYYINTWSIEGDNDGSNFRVPFFEYWTGDGESLAAKPLTATMTDLEAGDYDVTAWVRVRIKNGAEAPAYGITFQANEGEAVNVTGDQVGETQMYLKEVTATGTVAEDGVLKIKFNVAADNNISWLSFKNVKFEKQEAELEKFYIMGDGTPGEWTATTEIAFNEETQAFVYEYEATRDNSCIVFGDAAFTDWDEFNASHRYALEQSVDKDITTFGEAMQLVKVNEGTLRFATGKYTISVTKDLLCTITKVEEPIEPVYYVVGTMNNWTPSDEYKMTLNEEAEGVVEYMITLDLEANAELKVVKGNKDVWYPDGMDNNFQISDAGNYTIYFRPNADGGDNWYYQYIFAIKNESEELIRSWDFTQWSEETVANLKADAAASKLEGWSDVEKKTDAEADADPTEASKDNCFWLTDANGGELTANGVVIKELKGLVFDAGYAQKRSLAIAVNYPSTSLGDYAGPAYLWLGGGGSKQTVPCFTIPTVKAGQYITVEMESHKPSDARGIELYANTYASENKIGEAFKPTEKATNSWKIEEDCDVVVWNTSGCHIYTLSVDDVPTAITTINANVEAKGIYNMNGQKVNKAQKGLYIINGRKVVIK